MKGKKKRTKSQLSDNSRNSSQSQSEVANGYVKAERGKRLSKKSAKSQQSLPEEQNDVLDIHHGDSFVRQHIRPAFLKRWDGESNQLELREEQLNNMSPMLRVYWRYKSKNMNCIIFAQIGRVEFFAFEDDAIKLHEIFKKRLKKYSSFLMVNFWYKQIELAKIQLFERKIPVLMLNEIDDEQYKRENGIIKRQITQVITPSIFLSIEPKKYRQRLLLAIFTEKDNLGIGCVDIETNHFYLEHFSKTEKIGIHEIRRIINKYRPAQLLIQKKDQEIKKIAKQICQPYTTEINLPLKPLKELIDLLKESSDDDLFQRMQKLYLKQSPEKDQAYSLYSLVNVLHLLLIYLKNLNLQAKIFSNAIFQICDFRSMKLNPMFDAQVYQNLEVFTLKDEEDSFGKPGTLFCYLNHCATQSGSKLLKKWIDQPLRTLPQISLRQIAIENLLQNNGQILQLQKDLIKFERLQKKVGDIYHWTLSQSEEGKNILTKDIRFDKDYDQNKNPAVKRIKQICQVLEIFRKVQQYLRNFQSYDIESSLLRKITKIVQDVQLYRITKNQLEELDGLPSVQGLIQKIQSKIYVEQHTGIIEPVEGINEIFDNEKQYIRIINQKLQQLRLEWKKKLTVSKATYVSIRAKNQLQVPLGQVKNKKFPQLIFSSQTSKSIRYIIPEVSTLSDQLIAHEEALAQAYEPFSSMLVKQFCAHKHVWDLYISAISKLDVLMSISLTCLKMQPRCLPSFHQTKVQIINGYHPGLLQIKQKQKIKGNNLQFKQNEKVLLLTGPNMGGKSTLLRQTCLLAILAQLGSFVPCQKYESIIFDQIFCRIGASDRIIQGKSTFYVELEETKRIIQQATPNSLVIIDQLGRGTSTFDGIAIASSILKYICQQIQCYTLFSTHYFSLTEEYSLNPMILCGKIGYFFDANSNNIEFTYQLQEGIAQKSFANQVALKVGIHPKALTIADKKASDLEKSSKMKRVKAANNKRYLNAIRKFIQQQYQYDL